MPSFNIYIPSYKRADTISTHNLLEYCTVVVRESELEEYKKNDIKILALPDEIIDSDIKAFNWILQQSDEDVVAVIDDDIHHFIYRLENNVKVTDPKIITQEIERMAQLIVDLDISYIATPIDVNPKFYDREFKFVGIVGPLKIINKKKNKGVYNEIPFLSADDFVLQQILHNRIILISNYFTQDVGLNTNAGGSNNAKSIHQYYTSNETMKNKWGKYFVAGTDNKPGKLRVKR